MSQYMEREALIEQARKHVKVWDSPTPVHHTVWANDAADLLRQLVDALASQQAGKGEPVHPNHRPDLRYILTTLERVTPVVKHQKELREQVQASITGMRYVIERTEAASPPSREPQWLPIEKESK